jgi:PBSX family phage terminase large subunit
LPTQERFHLSPKKYRLYRGGLGSGKTLAGCHEALRLSLQYPGNFGVIARKTYQELEDSTMRTFFEHVCPQEIIRFFNKQSKHLWLFNGSEIVFRSLDTPEKFRSDEFGWWYIDEASEADEDAFKYLMGRLRRPGIERLCGFLTTNPVNVTHWIYKWFVTNRNKDEFEEFHAPTYENKLHLPENYIESLEKNYPPNWAKKYLNGDWGFTEGGSPVFTNFREDLHVRDLRYLTEMPIYVGLDFGFRRPAAVFSQIDEKDRWIILKELLPENITVHDFAKQIIQIQNKDFPLASRFIYYGDPAGNQTSDKSEKTSVEILREHEINVYSRKSSPTARIEIIQKRLQTWHEDSPSLLINKSGCSFLIDALAGGYHFMDRNNKQVEEPEKDGLYDHVIDALGYISVNMFAVKNAALLKNDASPSRIGNWLNRRNQ